MKCDICKLLNIREETRKHPNEVTVGDFGRRLRDFLYLIKDVSSEDARGRMRLCELHGSPSGFDRSVIELLTVCDRMAELAENQTGTARAVSVALGPVDVEGMIQRKRVELEMGL